MTAHQLIARASAAGILLTVTGGRVRVHGPEELVTPEFCAQLLQVKEELIRLLGAPPPLPEAAHNEPDIPIPAPQQALEDPLFVLARGKGFPGLYRFGVYVGAGEKLWQKFCARAHPGWRELAEEALQGYQMETR